ncbi:MAG TPA: NAD(P)/FAD-dependent oxidoreductase [Candidatus Eremiobacteraceae bacterium]
MDADVIVIGAGAAGLAAARSLAGSSLRVMLLEARDRFGGRVWSQDSKPATAPTELGAEFIHGPARETMALLHDAGIAALDTGDESWTCADSGGLQRNTDDFVSAANIFEASRDLPRDLSVDQFLRRFENDDRMRAMAIAARAFVEGFDAADPVIASARAIADEWRSGVDFASARPLGGYRPMFDRLRDACLAAGVRSVLSTVVRRISWGRGFVAVDASGADGKSVTVHARAAVVTLPVGVLKHKGDEAEVVFNPDLPAIKRDALQSIEMGSAVKVALWFRIAFWEQVEDGRYRNSAFFRCAGQPFPTYWTQFPLRSKLIIAWTGGPKAIALRGVSETERIERALNGFGSMFGELALARKEFERGVTHDWDLDPLSRGAYSYVAVGGGDARAALGTPVDETLFFAGEAMSVDGQGGTVNGALETGERAARDAATSLGARHAL